MAPRLLYASALVAAALAVPSRAQAYASDKMVQIPLKRHAVSHEPAHRSIRVLRQQERIRRRLGEDHDDDDDTSDLAGNATVGAVVFNEVPLGVGLGTHYAELYLGIPTQKASVIVDTGSHLTALPCSSCKGCGTHTDPLFDVSKSTTAKYVTCDQYSGCSTCDDKKCYISQSYTEGSMWSAVVVDDLVWLGGMNDKHPERFLKHYGVRFPVGCQTKETGLFITQKENGIMGFGRDKATLMSYMVANKRIEHDVFAMCFSPTGGGLVLGGVDYSHHRTQVAYTPLVPGNSGWYPVTVKDILVGDRTLGVSADKYNSGKGVIVDSGTTDTFFVVAAERAFKNLYSDLADVDYSEDIMHVSAKDLEKLPNITIVLEGDGDEEDIMLEIPASKYLTKADDGSYYGNFHFSERSGGVLGASTMVGYDVIFDMEKKRVGFAESLCDAMSPKTKTFPPPSEPKKINEPTIEETNSTASSSRDGSSDAPAKDASNAAKGDGTVTPSSSFFVQILMVSVVGVIAVVAFKRLRKLKTSWAPLAETDTGCNSLSRAEILNNPNDDDDDDDDDDPEAPRRATSPPRRNAAAASTSPSSRSPPLADSAARRGPSPRFTIGSDSESDHGGSPRDTTEL